jgi:hypothetical protein
MTDVQEAVDVAADTNIDQRPERAVAVRRRDVEISAGDGRTVSLRIAPFGEYATCADGLGGVPRGVAYREELMPGLFDKQLRAVNEDGRGKNIYLNFEHQQGLQGIIGHGISLRRERDGYHADFLVHDTPDGDKALILVREGVLRGASIESYWLKSIRSAAGVVQRVKAQLEAVAICRQGAYPSAVMTGIRTDELPEEIVLHEEMLPIRFNPELAARCRELGQIIPQRLEAHPDVTDTPAQTGTAEDGTRPDQANADLEVPDEHHDTE